MVRVFLGLKVTSRDIFRSGAEGFGWHGGVRFGLESKGRWAWGGALDWEREDVGDGTVVKQKKKFLGPRRGPKNFLGSLSYQ